MYVSSLCYGNRNRLLVWVVFVIAFFPLVSHSLSVVGETHQIRATTRTQQQQAPIDDDSRRAFLRKSILTSSSCSSIFLGLPPVLAADGSTLEKKLKDTILYLPSSSSSSSEFVKKGIDNTYYPAFLEGTWDVVQTLTDTQTPLGIQYLGGPQGDPVIAAKTIAQSESKVNQPVRFQLRYVPITTTTTTTTAKGRLIAEDRIFNLRERLNAFAGKTVVASVQYANVSQSNRNAILSLGGTIDDPLQTTMVYFKGPAAQKSFVLAHDGQQINTSCWVGYELQRSIFALTNTNTSPPITTDTEYIYKFTKIDENHIEGRLRIAGYLNPQMDTLYFETKNRAVSIQDYQLDMHRRAEVNP